MPPICARDILHTGPTGLGLLRPAPAVGALVMSVVLTRWPSHCHGGQSLLGAVAVLAVSTVVSGLSKSLGLALAISGAADTISVVKRLNLMQRETLINREGECQR